MKILVLYVFHEYNERVTYFCSHAIFQDSNVDFVIIHNNIDDINMNMDLFRDYTNVKFIQRENKGYDFAGWSHALLQDNLYQNYDFFIFANSSTLGPFLPSYYKKNWTNIFIDGLQNNVKLFGSTINNAGYNTQIDPYLFAHVQSYIFSMDKEALEYLIQCGIFSIHNISKTLLEAVHEKEILMSRKIIEKGWNIGCIHNYYKNIDFTFTTSCPDDLHFHFLGDIMYPYFYEARFWNLTDLVFVKGNRISID